ncbi:unnamed protein product [Adineta steineri]|uniref:C-type lectin domain-containing protein n=1 Tax=Adineta steineri TaxID=433720 RepID=A0A818QJZ0_9BILA|nr:unnamed protein product [Adineta steineri]
MTFLKLDLILFLLTIGLMEQVTSQCPSSFPNGDPSNLCYYYKQSSFSWSDAYNQCLTKTTDGILIEIFTNKQLDALKDADIIGKGLFWLGANNFASFRDSKWHWLDGSVVDETVIPWCPNSTYEVALGTYCAAYDIIQGCVNNYLCSTLLPAPCVSTENAVKVETKILASDKAISSTICTNAYGGAYANWWTYTLLLLNWFILFCFILYLSIRFNINKRTVIVTMIISILSFMMIIAFAILWGVQYQDILQIPLIVVIIGSLASVLFLMHICILVSNRRYVQRSLACIIVTIITIVIECSLMIGLILCIAHCSGYVTLIYSSIDKDIVAALLSGILAATSIAFYTSLLYLLGDASSDRRQSARSHPANSLPLNVAQQVAPRRSQFNNNNGNARGMTTKQPQMDRGTSPVDERVLEEFYHDRPKDLHQYELDGRQYVVYEGHKFSDIDVYRKDLTQAMLLQEPEGLRESIARAKSSVHASTLTEEIHQAESLLIRLT